MTSPSAQERWLSYTTTIVRIDHPRLGSFVVEPAPAGHANGEYPAPGQGPIHIMTAHNPGRALSVDENDRRQQELLARLSRRSDVEVWNALGGDRRWQHTEDSVAIVGLDDGAALELARGFDQDAIFSWVESQWLLLSCVDDRTWSAGWRIRAAAT
jgi:hypothetical protein